MLAGFKPDSISIEKEELHFERTQVVVCISETGFPLQINIELL